VTLRPYPFGALVRRAFEEIDREQAIFGLSRRRWFTGFPGLDLSVVVHGRRVATPFGPAAGPHTQLAQNIVLSWLAGARALELKTVQVRDDLAIPRPCIDMRTTGFNVEWSQELPLSGSLEEYVKASMLLRILAAGGVLPEQAGGADFLFDLSIGYDLAGIRSEPMTRLLGAMLDARASVDRLRAQIPLEFARWRDLDFAREIARSVTLSTFHGCPPGEIEAIVDHLQRTFGLHCTVKFNPTLLGRDRVGEILHDLGYDDARVPEEVFARDLQWEQAVDLVERCGASAAARGVGFGAKFTNTLVVENRGDFLPASERHSYLSGRPLHALAMELVRDFRARFGDRHPISFSAGIERWNFADAVALGLKPVTVCTDLLREGGYARASGYFAALRDRMTEAGATTIDELVHAGPAHVAQDVSPVTTLRNTTAYLATLMARPELRAGAARPPRKVGTHLARFDCLTCDKCLPVCPNHALFTFPLAPARVPTLALEPAADHWTVVQRGEMATTRRHQIGVFADFCNECGNCDVFCPEHGGPYRTKPWFFGSEPDWAAAPQDGFWVTGTPDDLVMRGRIDGREYRLERAGGRVRFAADLFDVVFNADDLAGLKPCPTAEGRAAGVGQGFSVAVSLEGRAEGRVDLAPCALMMALARAVLDRSRINYINVRV
jgi:putative selenate reductase